MQPTECFKILEVEPGAPWQVVKKSYHNLAKRFHPDLNPQSPDAESRFKEVNLAFQVLRSHFTRSDNLAPIKRVSDPMPATGLWQRIWQNPKLEKWKDDWSEYLCELDTRVFHLDVHKKIRVSANPSGASIHLKAGKENFDIKIPGGDWHQMSLCILGKGEASLFSKRRGDLILNLQKPLKEMVTTGESCFSYEMTLDRAKLGQVLTLNSSEGPIKFVLPRNTVEGQTFSLKSGDDSDTRHILTVRLG